MLIKLLNCFSESLQFLNTETPFFTKISHFNKLDSLKSLPHDAKNPKKLIDIGKKIIRVMDSEVRGKASIASQQGNKAFR